MDWENLVYLFTGFAFSSLTLYFQALKEKKQKMEFEKSRLRGLIEIYFDYTVYHQSEEFNSKYSWKLYNFSLNNDIDVAENQILEKFFSHKGSENELLEKATQSKSKLIDCICTLGVLYDKPVSNIVKKVLKYENINNADDYLKKINDAKNITGLNKSFNDSTEFLNNYSKKNTLLDTIKKSFKSNDIDIL